MGTAKHSFCGITRAMDELGRIVLPKEYRDHFGFNQKDIFEVCVTTDEEDNASIIAKKVSRNCIFCHGKNSLHSVLDKDICESCMKKLCRKITTELETDKIK